MTDTQELMRKNECSWPDNESREALASEECEDEKKQDLEKSWKRATKRKSDTQNASGDDMQEGANVTKRAGLGKEVDLRAAAIPNFRSALLKSREKHRLNQAIFVFSPGSL